MRIRFYSQNFSAPKKLKPITYRDQADMKPIPHERLLADKIFNLD